MGFRVRFKASCKSLRTGNGLTAGTFNKISFLKIGVTDMKRVTAAPAPAPQNPTERSHGVAP